MEVLTNIQKILEESFKDKITIYFNIVNELTVDVTCEYLLELCEFLKNNKNCKFLQLTDISGVDYLHYGLSEWETLGAKNSGFSKGVHLEKIPTNVRVVKTNQKNQNSSNKYFSNNINNFNEENNNNVAANISALNTKTNDNKLNNKINLNINNNANDNIQDVKKINNGYRYAVVYHLLSIEHNVRIRVRVSVGPKLAIYSSNKDINVNANKYLNKTNFSDIQLYAVPTVIGIWDLAAWYEREVYDLFGILFENHPDLRRILLDYTFVGHPLRKDFPLIGNIELRYDEEQKRLVYEEVSITNRQSGPKVIREKR